MIEKPPAIAIVFLNNVGSTKSEAISVVHNERFHERGLVEVHKANVSRTARRVPAALRALRPEKTTNWRRASAAVRSRTNEPRCLKHSLVFRVPQHQNTGPFLIALLTAQSCRRVIILAPAHCSLYHEYVGFYYSHARFSIP